MIQKPMFAPQTEWLPPTNFPDLSKYDEVAIDLETKDPQLKTMGSGSVTGRGRIVGIALAVKDWSGYFPIAHEGGGNMDEKIVMDYFRTILNYPSTKIFHNAMYDVCFIRAAGLKINGTIVDTMIAGSLVDENRFRYDLGSLGRDYVGIGKNEAVLKETADHWGIDAKSEMYKLPAMYVGEYAEQDATLTLALWQEMKKEIQHQDIQSIFELECELFPCLVDMRFLGVRVDLEAATALKNKLSSQEKECLQKVKKETSIDVQIWAARSIAKVFDKLSLPYAKTEKTGSPSFTKNFLSTHNNPVVKSISKAREILEIVGISPDAMGRFPHQFSGGQRQRICIARAVVMEPKLIVADEAVSALDVSVQKQVLDLFLDIRQRFGMAMLFITHDLRVAAQVCDRVVVMQHGKVVEQGKTTDVYNNPQHPYTKALVKAVPVPHVDQSHEPLPIKGNIPDSTILHKGCKFSDRCINPSNDCKEGNIPMGLIEIKPGHWVDQCCVNCG